MSLLAEPKAFHRLLSHMSLRCCQIIATAQEGTLLPIMPLKIKPVGVGDLERLVEIEVAALKALEIFRVLCPNGIDASREDSMHTETGRALANDTTAEYMKVVDTDEQNKIVAFAKWQTPGKILADLMSTSIYPVAKRCQLTPAMLTDGAGTLMELLSSQASNTRKRIMANEPHSCKVLRLLPDRIMLTGASPGQDRN